MIESNLEEGNQALSDDINQLKKGVSGTDACVNWLATEMMIKNAAEELFK